MGPIFVISTVAMTAGSVIQLKNPRGQGSGRGPNPVGT